MNEETDDLGRRIEELRKEIARPRPDGAFERVHDLPRLDCPCCGGETETGDVAAAPSVLDVWVTGVFNVPLRFRNQRGEHEVMDVLEVRPAWRCGECGTVVLPDRKAVRRHLRRRSRTETPDGLADPDPAGGAGSEPGGDVT